MNLKEKLRGALLEEKENKNSLVIESKILDGHFGTLKKVKATIVVTIL